MSMIFERTSIRKYENKAVSKEQIEMLLKAAMAAPSAKNVQPWEFVVLQNRETLLKITEFHPFAQMLKEAPAAIVVCGNKTKIALEGVEDLWAQDCAAATQNILLQATDMGLGSVWIGIYPNKPHEKNVTDLVNLPDYIVPFSIVAIGYPAEEPEPKDKFNKEKIHWEKWYGVCE